MKDVHEMLQQADHVDIRHTYREANMAADWLSKYGHAITGNWSTIECFSTEIRDIVRDDVIERTFVRRGA